MKQYLKKYEVVMRTAGPVYIGSGREIGKKEYLFLNREEVGIPDIQKLYGELERRGKIQEFEQYLLNNNRDDLTEWLRSQRISTDELTSVIRYRMDCGDAIVQKGKRPQVMECIKDAYGNPYVPGSSLKGMFRTIFLASDILKNPSDYRNMKSSLPQKAMQRAPRNVYLKREAAELESIAFRTLRRGDTRPTDAVNDIMQGFAVSDSAPLSTKQLVLCQRIELHTDGTEKKLPVLLECIKPDTEIRFTITIDTGVCSLTADALQQAVGSFMLSYYENWGKAFHGIDMPEENCVLLGGGTGFVSKTVVYPLLGKEEGIKMSQKIFDMTGVPRMHKHDKDGIYGASPHIMKCTSYQGKTMMTGLCRLERME